MTKVYRNTSKEEISIPGLADIAPGEQVSITGEYLPPVVLENYPGLVDVLEEEANAPVEEPTKTTLKETDNE